MSTPNEFSKATQVLAAALLAATVDPADAIRLLSSLATFRPSVVTDTSSIGMAMSTMQSATGDLFRRSAVIALARAAAIYSPASYDDAANIRTIVCGFIDNEILTAGNQGEDATYNALRTLRSAVVTDLTTRGASLSRVTTWKLNAPLPSLILANRFYQDITRNDELIIQANVRHPAFMPTAFKALSE